MITALREIVNMPNIQYFSGSHCIARVLYEDISTKRGMVARGDSRSAQKVDAKEILD